MSKIFTWFKWCVCLLILGGLLFGGLKYMSHDWRLGHSNDRAAYQEYHSGYQGSWNDRQNMNNYDDRRANHGEFTHIQSGHAYHKHGKQWVPWLLPFILACGLAIAGWRWVKRSEGNLLKKWLGITLILLALLPLIGPIIGIALIALFIFLITRNIKDVYSHMNLETPASFYNSETDSPYKHEWYTDFLDEWEQETMKKKNKKEDVQ
ncbi:hypothetical protein DNHGIG_08540 [Collibacillus ludicampi]|uniref:DUF4064 domain-containing protein n=1 Tax=Collibacillus ludicampi TaxID=2771369 RepID=A0AAV4LBX6_9BACL|nr:hypothetical protein [Collibacillus ludicampi]GIM45305.1 hypothetical protein DNHGIG_08540 [Collibacillus ludicampi]